MSAPVVGGARPAHPHNHLAQSRQVMPPAQVNDVSVPDHGSVAHPDEVFLATAGYDHTVKFWQAHTGQCTRTIQHSDSQVNCLEISPDGQLLAACGFQHIRMYDISAGGAGAGVGGGAAAAAGSGAVVNYEGVRKNVMDVGFQDAGRWIYTGGEDGTVKIWDPRARNLECQRSYSAGAPVNAVRLLPNQMELVVGDQAGRVHLWNLRTDRGEQFTPQPTASIQSVAINSLGKKMAAVTNKGTCHVYDMIKPTPSAPIPPLNPTGGGDTSPSVIRAPSTTQFLSPGTTIPAHSRYALKCKFSPDSTLLATAGADQTARVWRLNGPEIEQIQELKVAGGQRWVWDLAFSADAQYLLTASSDGVARLWGVADGKVKREYLGHQKALTCLAFRDGQA